MGARKDPRLYVLCQTGWREGGECREKNSFSSRTPSVLARGRGGHSGQWVSESSLLILHVPTNPQVSLGGNQCLGTVSPFTSGDVFVGVMVTTADTALTRAHRVPVSPRPVWT